jgi:hypothetical protein
MRAFLILPIMLAPLPAMAQQTDEQLWLQTNGSVELGDRDKLTLEGIARFSDRAEGFSHYELGLLYAHKLAGGVELSFGYRHVADYDRGVTLPTEERTRQMIMVPLGSGFNARLRAEQRFHSSGGEVGFRLRPRLGYEMPLGEGGLKLFATQEHFINLNTTAWGQRGGYERMRNAVGLSIPLGGRLRAEAGYLNQYRFGRAGKRDQMDHALTLTLNFNVASLGHGD